MFALAPLQFPNTFEYQPPIVTTLEALKLLNETENIPLCIDTSNRLRSEEFVKDNGNGYQLGVTLEKAHTCMRYLFLLSYIHLLKI